MYVLDNKSLHNAYVCVYSLREELSKFDAFNLLCVVAAAAAAAEHVVLCCVVYTHTRHLPTRLIMLMMQKAVLYTLFFFHTHTQ